jgi:hypothetical protein
MEIVYVHLGETKNGYLASSIDRSLSLFPQIKHTLILDSLESMESNSSLVSLVENGSRVLDSGMIQREVDLDFRTGYWNLTLERIFAVLNYQIKKELRNVLHVESDVILMESFPFQNLQECSYVHWCEYGAGHDVASLLYIPDAQSAALLKEKLLSILKQNPNLTDMQLLFIARNTGAKVRLFPSAAPDCCDTDPTLVIQNCKCLPDDFIFDGLTYGMYLTGQDPRNNYGRYPIGDNSPYDSGATHLNPRKYSWSLDMNSNLQAESFCCGKVLSLQNLHIHSKNLKLFEFNWSSDLRKLVKIANKHERVNFFSWKVFYKMFRLSISSGNTRLFLANSPPVARFKRIILSLANGR